MTWLGALLLAGSFMQALTLLEVERYWMIFQDLPAGVRLARYVVSWLIRIVTIPAAVGVCRRRELGRRVVIAVCAFTMLTVYWKHPIAGFRRHTAWLDEVFQQAWPEEADPLSLRFSDYVVPAVVGACVLDVLFAAAVIYVLTRPSVRRQFS